VYPLLTFVLARGAPPATAWALLGWNLAAAAALGWLGAALARLGSCWSGLDLSYTPPFGSPWDAIQLAAQDWVRQTRTLPA
jgi:hypothetical protein